MRSGADALQTHGWLRLLIRNVVIICICGVVLAACVPVWPNADWSGSPDISKTQVLRFVAQADCSAPWLFNPVTSDFYQVSSLHEVPGEPWRYDIQMQSTGGQVVDRLYITQWWTATKKRSGPAFEYDTNRRCGVLVDVPKSATSNRPYFAKNAETKKIEHEDAVNTEATIFRSLILTFVVLLVPASFAFENNNFLWVMLSAAVGILIVSLMASDVCIHSPWREFQTAQAYWAWFDALPHSGGWLLPIAADEFLFLLRGPPNDTEVYVEAWLTGTLAVAIVWVVVAIPAAWIGWYWILTPLPLEELHERATKEGRTPTPEELDAALWAALAGKKAWQVDVMERKARVFAARFHHFSDR